MQEEQQPRWWQRMNQWFPASRVGAWLFSYTLHHIDRLLLALSNGRLSVPGLVTGLPVIMLTTVGAKSRTPHTVPLVGMRDGDKVVVIASNWGRTRHPAWYYNLRVNPEVTLSIKGHTRTYVARQATHIEREYYWHRAVELYRGYGAYEQRTGGRQIPMMVLTPKSLR